MTTTVERRAENYITIGPDRIRNLIPFDNLTFSLAGQPNNPFQRKITDDLRRCLEGEEFRGGELPLPHRKALREEVPSAYIVYGNGHLGSRTNSVNIRPKLPKKYGAPLLLMINTSDDLPIRKEYSDATNRHLGRTEGAWGAAHCSVIFTEPGRAMWVSTQGNVVEITGDSDSDVIHQVAQRFQAHFAAPLRTHRYDGEGFSTSWEALKGHPYYEILAARAHKLGSTVVPGEGRTIIEDHVNLLDYIDDWKLAMKISHAINELDDGVGESMASQTGPKGVVGVTQTGGRKVDIDADPKNFTPMMAIAKDGYVIPEVEGKPFLFKNFKPISREGWENGLGRIAHSWCMKNNYDSSSTLPPWQQFYMYMQEKWTHPDYQFMPIYSTELPHSTADAWDHSHWKAIETYRKNIIITEPDYGYFPTWDYGCGTDPGGWALMSALMKVKAFYNPNGLGRTIIIANLPGHGCVAIGERMEEVTDALINGVKLVTPPLV